MAQSAHPPLPSAFIKPHSVLFAALLLGAGAAGTGCSGGPDDQAMAAQGWTSSGVNAVSRPVVGSGVTAVTGLRPDGSLETSVFDLAGGRRLWSRPATMAGRLTGMGVQPPAVTGTPGHAVVAAVEPRASGRWSAALVARDARTGAERWARPVDSTFGPSRCGPHVCLSEFVARENARFVALDAVTGRTLWKTPGIAEVEHDDTFRAVLFRLAEHPSVEARDLRTGRRMWTFPVEGALGEGVDLSGGWAFGTTRAPRATDTRNAADPDAGALNAGAQPGAQGSGVHGGQTRRGQTGEVLVGYMAPHQARKGKALTPYGFFGLRLTDGKPVWTRKRMLRVYPSANPAVALFARRIIPRGKYGEYGAFERVDPRTGRTLATVAADRAPRAPWLLSFPADMTKLGFVVQGRPGVAYELRDGARVTDRALRAWSFCTMNPPELKITGMRGFYPVAALCAYDVATGRKAADPGPPPAWYTGSADGWRVWRDERGAVRGVREGGGPGTPGMYGAGAG